MIVLYLYLGTGITFYIWLFSLLYIKYGWKNMWKEFNNLFAESQLNWYR